MEKVYDPKESILLKFTPKQDGTAVGMSTYTAGAALDGTTGSLKVQVTIYELSGNTVATDTAGNSLSAKTMYRGDASNENSAVLTIVTGINPTVKTKYMAHFIYDKSQAGSNPVRIEDKQYFYVTPTTPQQSTMPYTP